MIELTKGRVNILLDGQFGSTGKGLFAEYIAKHNNIDIAITNAGPNAGHTFYYNGIKAVTKLLPVTGILNPNSIIYISRGALINISLLFSELEFFNIDLDRVYIHPQTTVITNADVVMEKMTHSSFAYISSTQNGVGNALSRKIVRASKVAKDYPELKRFIMDYDLESALEGGDTAFMEVPQGFSLSLNSNFYPYCTSRDINVSSALNDCDVHPVYLGKVITCIRTFPIRVGNLPEGYSGDFYYDSIETTWEALGLPVEYTTNTHRVRRVATFSHRQYRDMLRKLRPDYIFLNFCNYLDKTSLEELLRLLPEVTHLGFGSEITDVCAKISYITED